LSEQQCQVRADNSDVLYIEDWSQVMQKDAIAFGKVEANERKWAWRTDIENSIATFGNTLVGEKWRDDLPLPQLTYPLNLHGWYAIFVCTPKGYGIRMRLSGDERTDFVWSPRPFQEVFWRWCRMDRQHLILKQNHTYHGYVTGQIDYVKFVPLSDEQVRVLESQFGEPDKIVAGYFEPYSWEFFEDLQESLQHWERIRI